MERAEDRIVRRIRSFATAVRLSCAVYRACLAVFCLVPVGQCRKCRWRKWPISPVACVGATDRCARERLSSHRYAVCFAAHSSHVDYHNRADDRRGCPDLPLPDGAYGLGRGADLPRVRLYSSLGRLHQGARGAAYRQARCEVWRCDRTAEGACPRGLCDRAVLPQGQAKVL